jgi:hypothetical protein
MKGDAMSTRTHVMVETRLRGESNENYNDDI